MYRGIQVVHVVFWRERKSARASKRERERVRECETERSRERESKKTTARARTRKRFGWKKSEIVCVYMHVCT